MYNTRKTGRGDCAWRVPQHRREWVRTPTTPHRPTYSSAPGKRAPNKNGIEKGVDTNRNQNHFSRDRNFRLFIYKKNNAQLHPPNTKKQSRCMLVLENANIKLNKQNVRHYLQACITSRLHLFLNMPLILTPKRHRPAEGPHRVQHRGHRGHPGHRPRELHHLAHVVPGGEAELAELRGGRAIAAPGDRDAGLVREARRQGKSTKTGKRGSGLLPVHTYIYTHTYTQSVVLGERASEALAYRIEQLQQDNDNDNDSKSAGKCIEGRPASEKQSVNRGENTADTTSLRTFTCTEREAP